MEEKYSQKVLHFMMFHFKMVDIAKKHITGRVINEYFLG